MTNPKVEIVEQKKQVTLRSILKKQFPEDKLDEMLETILFDAMLSLRKRLEDVQGSGGVEDIKYIINIGERYLTLFKLLGYKDMGHRILYGEYKH